MPNHVSNIIRIKSLQEDDWKKEDEAFKSLESIMKTENSPFDFNVLIPYPEQYRVLDEAREEAEKQPGVKWSDLPKDGYNQGGYDWCIEHWGTKWNAYDIAFGYDEVSFCTAWATPLPIWEALSRRFPEMRIEVEYADEDRGSNCGKLVYLNGDLFSEEDWSKHPQAELFARAVIAEQHEAHHYVELQALREKQKVETPTEPEVNK